MAHLDFASDHVRHWVRTHHGVMQTDPMSLGMFDANSAFLVAVGLMLKTRQGVRSEVGGGRRAAAA